MTMQPRRKPPTVQEIIADQRAQAERDRARAKSTGTNMPVEKQATAVVPAKPASTAITTPDTCSYEERYIDEVAPATFPGRLIKFTKEGAFITADDGEEISSDRDFVALCDEVLIGWIKFSGDEGVPPERVQGILFDGFTMPPRDSLGDTDESAWPIGLSGQPEDPWLHQQVLVLQDREAGELFSFSTTSRTGRRSVGTLLRHFNRLQRQHPDTYPVVRLKAGGFHHKDDRIGFVHTPTFAVVGRAPKTSAAIPDGSVAADLQDEIPF